MSDFDPSSGMRWELNSEDPLLVRSLHQTCISVIGPISFKAATATAAACPDTTVVSVVDREADIYELFALANKPRMLHYYWCLPSTIVNYSKSRAVYLNI